MTSRELPDPGQRKRTCVEHPAYVAGCPFCKAKNRAHRLRYHRLHGYGTWAPSLVDSEETTLRVRQLAAIGYSLREISRRLTFAQEPVLDIAHGVTKRVKASTAAAVEELYDELMCFPDPQGRSASYARNVAAKKGWKAPGSPKWKSTVDVDEVAVARAARAEDPGRRLGLAEKAAVVAMVAPSQSAERVAQAMGVCRETVSRRRAAAERANA